MDRSNFWLMQLSQTGPHFKLEEVWFWNDIFPSSHNRLNTNVRGSGKVNETWKGIFYLLNYFCNNTYHCQMEKGSFSIVFEGKWSISYLKVASIWITEDFAVTAAGIFTQRKLNICLNLSWNLQFWIALCHKFYCITWQNSY